MTCDVFIYERRSDGEFVGECECGLQLRTNVWNGIEPMWFKHAGKIRHLAYDRYPYVPGLAPERCSPGLGGHVGYQET